ncbi:hypothetical protein [uncultured Erythrobacter sp.]|uniref:hypothetical protein n=1 Tax=uncultured Erythrobacter sp. TaxID=263913 RepID=UPI00262FF239|nr:hypothetical protein [uncultured Erythrobacter sp.]
MVDLPNWVWWAIFLSPFGFTLMSAPYLLRGRTKAYGVFRGMLISSVGAVPLALLIPFVYDATFENGIVDGIGLLLLVIFGWGTTFGYWSFALVEWLYLRFVTSAQ